MKIKGEELKFLSKESAEFLFVILLSTFLLLFLYHNDCWRPVKYWLFLNGLILFIIPLLSLVLIGKKTRIFVKIISVIAITTVFSLLITLSLNRHYFRTVRYGNAVLAISSAVVAVTVIILFLSRVDLRKFGISFGKPKFWVPITILFFLIMIPIIYSASRMPSFQKTYPMFSLARKSVTGFIVAELSLGIFFVFWEFFFRGYMLFSLEKRTGFLVANAIQAMAFAFMHFGKPELEVYSALAGGLIVGWLAWRSKTFLPAFLIHWGIQFSMDFFAVIK